MAKYKEGDEPKFKVGDKLRRLRNSTRNSTSRYIRLPDIVTVRKIEPNREFSDNDPFYYDFEEWPGDIGWLDIEMNFELAEATRKESQQFPILAELLRQGKLRKGDWLVALKTYNLHRENHLSRIEELGTNYIDTRIDENCSELLRLSELSQFRLPTKNEIREVRKFKVGDKVEIVGKSLPGFTFVDRPASKGLWNKQDNVGYINKIHGDPYKENNRNNWFVVWPEKDKQIGDFFALRDLELIEPTEGWQVTMDGYEEKVEEKSTKKQKPQKQTLTLLKKTIEAVDEMLRLISKSEDFQKSGEIFYHLIREVEGSPRHPDISYFIDGYPRLKHDDTWRIVVKLFQGEYGNTKELKKDLENLKRKIKQKIKGLV